MVSDRSLQVLRAIVTDYVASHEPVASKAIVERYDFDVSAATIRNDMAQLEDAELIHAPHSSAGRVPTDKGYRLFVDTLGRQQPLSRVQRHAIERFLGESGDVDEAMQRTVRILSQLTNQVAVAQHPATGRQTVRHIDLVPIASERVLSVLITGTGTVEQRVVHLPSAEVAHAWVNGIRDKIAAATVGSDTRTAHQAVSELRASLEVQTTPAEFELVTAILDVVQHQLLAESPERISVAGIANLSRTDDFQGSFTAVLDAIEEQVTLLKLFGELVAEGREVAASIGQENERYGLGGTAVLASPYQRGAESAARVGVLGPTAMDYASNMVAVRAVARYLSKLLGTDENIL